ncbi:uncharacterized protein PgNI_07939 [Pyricularia grisea]|uniref:Uncharacterized protein n=1 Tax=Pyricularia grisea TaxID=148305 RepID=A0A6P8B2W4_PYRGI|nr:uncharacterized protein PgNI_07939 [Pyricularia grisea]TLD09144.1 hypothetical protein PgNI_07939 [Pyricularia grisea]
MQFSKISVAAISMVLFSLASAAPATQAAPLEPRANCYAQAVADGSSCVVGCVTGNETGGVSTRFIQ